jgi:hypothetical protein
MMTRYTDDIEEGIAQRLMAGEKFPLGPASFVIDAWRKRHPKLVDEALAGRGLVERTVIRTERGLEYLHDLVKSGDELPGLLSKAVTAPIKLPFKGAYDGFKSLIDGMSNFNAALEFTLRVRLYHRLLIENFQAITPTLNRRVLSEAATEFPHLRILMEMLWNEAGYEPAKMAELVKDFVGQASPDRPPEWSFLYPRDLDPWLQTLHPEDRTNVVMDVLGALRTARSDALAKGERLTPARIQTVFADIRRQIEEKINLQAQTPGRPPVPEAPRPRWTPAQAAAKLNQRQYRARGEFIQLFEQGFGPLGRVEHVTDDARPLRIELRDGRPTLLVNLDAASKLKRVELRDQARRALENVLYLTNKNNIALKFGSPENYQSWLRRFYSDPELVATANHDLFVVIGRQLDANPQLRRLMDAVAGPVDYQR